MALWKRQSLVVCDRCVPRRTFRLPGTIILPSQGKSKQPPNSCSLMFPLQEGASEPRSVWNVLGSCGKSSWEPTWIPVLGAKIRIFLPWSPNAVQPSNCLKIHPVAVVFPLTERALLPILGFQKQGGGLQLLAWGPLEVQGALDQVTPA